MEILTSNEDVIFSTTMPSGSDWTPPLHRDMHPFKVKGYALGRSAELVPQYFYNIDDPQWTPDLINSDMELFDENQLRVVQVGQEEVVSSDGTVVTVPIFEIYKTYLGFVWEFYEVGFGNKAKYEKIQNRFSEPLRFKIVETGEEVIVEPFQEVEIQNPIHPGRLCGFYMEPKEELWAYQRGSATKPPEEYFYQHIIRQTKRVYTRLFIICMHVD